MITSTYKYGDHSYLLTYEGEGELTLVLLDGPLHTSDTGNTWPPDSEVSRWAGVQVEYTYTAEYPLRRYYEVVT